MATLWCAILAVGMSGVAAARTPAANGNISFAVVAGLTDTLSSDTSTRALLTTLDTRRLEFIVLDGALHRPNEPCGDQSLDERRALLDTSSVPVIVVPGQHDWAACDQRAAGSHDPVERLDFLRQTLFDEPASLGVAPLRVARESELTRFRQYRENTRWEAGETLFVTLNVPDDNNRYLNAGGRNGEFEDRAIATAFWLSHAGEYAKRRKLKSIVILIDADPDFARFERRERFAWLGLGRRLPRDGYLEFKRALIELAHSFKGPVVLIHGTSREGSHRFRIDRPLRDDKGELVGNFTRIAIARPTHEPRWIEVHVEPARWPMFRIEEHAMPNAARFAAPSSAPTGIGPPASDEFQPNSGTSAPFGQEGSASSPGSGPAPGSGLWIPGGTTAPPPSTVDRLPPPSDGQPPSSGPAMPNGDIPPSSTPTPASVSAPHPVPDRPGTPAKRPPEALPPPPASWSRP